MLTSFIKTGQDWSRFKTSVRGVFDLKLPASRSSPTRLAVECNPVDEGGKTKKLHELVLRSNSELEDFKKIFQDNKLSKLLSAIDAVNSETKAAKRRDGEDILEL
jgi:hypothetical protein